ncbi:hypothetical protein G7Y79_00026g059240 [Physcia stellaris]|nr:hypothetical protein G7Y79_00026g059240 [Physcia stellaris]
MIFLLSLASVPLFVAAQQCFFPAGTKAKDHIPCNGSSTTTHCCANGAACLTNGLCFLQWDSSLNTGACTQKQWSDKTCFQQCIQTVGRTDGEDTLYRCSNNDWCCSSNGNTTSCCQDTTDGSNLFKLPDEGIAQIENGTNFISGYTIAAKSALQTGTAEPSQSTGMNGAKSTQNPDAAASTEAVQAPSANPTKKEDDGQKVVAVGAGVGVGVGVPLLAALGAVLFLYIREKRLNKDLKGQLAAGTGGQYGSEQKAPFPRLDGLEELQSGMGYSQLPAARQDVNAELDSSVIKNRI